MAADVRFTREELELYSRGRHFDRRGILVPSPRKSHSFGVETINGYRTSRQTSSSPTTSTAPQNRLSAPPALFSAFSPTPKPGNGHVPTLETLGEDPEYEEDDEDDDRTVVNRRSAVVRERWSTSRVPTGPAGSRSGWSGSVFRNTSSGVGEKVSRPSSLRRAAKAEVESIAEVDEDVETEGEDVSGGGLQASSSGGDIAMESVDVRAGSVAEWLVENDYGNWVETFSREEVDSWDVMATLNLEALLAMGFTVGTSLRLLVSIKKHLKVTGMGQDSSNSSQSVDSVSVDELHTVVAEIVAQSLKDNGRKLRPRSMVHRLPWNSSPRSPPRNSSSSTSTTPPSSPLQQFHRTSSARNLTLKPDISNPPRSASVDRLMRLLGGRSASREPNRTPSASSSRNGSPSRWGEKRRREGSPGKGVTGSTGGRGGVSSSGGRFQQHP
ncbi:hypothetical protein BJ742DRAFT_813137 [Cladochytrium replicatum]|nr:hypothetical protein BJ742DRAFT_813137 [Cladochytrium replicatum]